MTNRKIIYVYFNVDTGQLVDVNNVPVSNNVWPSISFKEYPVMFLTLYKGFQQGVAVPYTDFPETMTFTAAVDTDFDHTTGLMIKSRFAADINIPGDWASASITQGRLSIRLSANTLEYEEKIGTTEILDAYFELQGFIQTDIEGTPTVVLSSILRFPIIAKNTLDDSEGSTPLPMDPLSGYYPYWTVDALLAQKSDLYHTASGHGDFRQDSAATGTDFTYGAGRLQVGKTVYNVSGSTLALTATGYHYVEVDQYGAVSDSLTGFSRGKMPLYQVYSDGSDLDPVYDKRTWLNLTPTKDIGELNNVSKLLLETGANLTAVTGSISPTGAVHVVYPETGLTDDITAVTMTSGLLCLLMPPSSSYTLTLKNGTYLQTPDGQDYDIPPTGVLAYRYGSVTKILTETKTRHGSYDSVFIPAGTFTPATANGPRYERYVSATHLVNQDVYWFAGTGATANQIAWAGVELPDIWDKSSLKAYAHWLSPATASAGARVDFVLSSRALNPGSSPDQAMGSAITASDSVTAGGARQGKLFTGSLTPAGTIQNRSLLMLKLERAYNVGTEDEVGFLGLSLQFKELTTEPGIWT